MIIKLNNLLLTSTHLQTVCVGLVAEGPSCGLFATGSYLITAFDATGRIWISRQDGEGMETAADTLAGYLLDHIRLPGAAGELTVEIAHDELDRLVSEYYAKEF